VPHGIEIRRATGADADAVADLWLTSFDDALPTVQRPHDDDHVRRWIRDHLVARTEAWVAVRGGEVVAILGLAPGWIEQLYVAPGHQGSGVGGRLVGFAQERADDELQLWTFQVNARARAFYRRHGFREVELTDGATNQEREPDVRLLWTRAGGA
jgi:GNAT superfamily N-acetyltransferase